MIRIALAFAALALVSGEALAQEHPDSAPGSDAGLRLVATFLFPNT